MKHLKPIGSLLLALVLCLGLATCYLEEEARWASYGDVDDLQARSDHRFGELEDDIGIGSRGTSLAEIIGGSSSYSLTERIADLQSDVDDLQTAVDDLLDYEQHPSSCITDTGTNGRNDCPYTVNYGYQATISDVTTFHINDVPPGISDAYLDDANIVCKTPGMPTRVIFGSSTTYICG